MQFVVHPPYNNVVLGPVETFIIDHLGGFDSSLQCRVLDYIAQIAPIGHQVVVEYIFSNQIKQSYPTLSLRYSSDFWKKENYVESFNNYTAHPELTFQNFICSFNGTSHVSRQLLVAILQRFGYFNPEYCSKNFSFTVDRLDGHVTQYTNDQDRFYRKFFLSSDSDIFFNSVNSFGHQRIDHKNNIYNLDSKITQSFLHIVSETMATSYYPFVTEKFLYSIVTRGLFLAYAQPGWHDHVEKYYGFKKYTKLFDYQFDSIQNPIKRLVSLMTMVSKFSIMSSDDWRDLYLLEQDTVEYNYDHYHSGNYLTYFNDDNS